MADSGCSTAKFFCVCDNAYYFQVQGPQCAADELDTGIEADVFDAAEQEMNLLQCNDNKFLILHSRTRFEKKFLTSDAQQRLGNQFSFQFYNDVSENNREGIPVTLYVNNSGEKLVVCCNSNQEIYPEPMEIQTRIEASEDRAVFYMIGPCPSHKYVFESSLYKDKFLGLDTDKSNRSVVKLVLRPRGPDNQWDEFKVLKK